jgi:hypothetical protein
MQCLICWKNYKSIPVLCTSCNNCNVCSKCAITYIKSKIHLGFDNILCIICARAIITPQLFCRYSKYVTGYYISPYILRFAINILIYLTYLHPENISWNMCKKILHKFYISLGISLLAVSMENKFMLILILLLSFVQSFQYNHLKHHVLHMTVVYIWYLINSYYEGVYNLTRFDIYYMLSLLSTYCYIIVHIIRR